MNKNFNPSARNLSLCLCICLAAGAFFNDSLAAEVAVIRIKYRWASELQPIVRSMLSPKGTVTVSNRINSLIVVDKRDSIQRVRAYLDQFDKPLEQVRIHVRFHESRAAATAEVSARGKISNDNIRVAVNGKKKDGIDQAGEDRYRSQDNYSEFFVFATAGTPAFIRAAKEIPYLGRWPEYTRRYSGGGAARMFQTVETGFDVTPTIAGDIVHLRIVPRYAYDQRKEAVVRFYGAQTEVTTKFGRWVEIVGSNNQHNDVIREVLSLERNGQRHSISMSLMVEKP